VFKAILVAMVSAGSASFRLRLAVMMIAVAGILAVFDALAVEFKREENVGDLHLRIPLEYLAGTTEHEAFLLAVHWPSLEPIGGDESEVSQGLGDWQDSLVIGADEEQLTMSLDQRFETMRRFVGAGGAVGERYGLAFFPRDENLSRGHYDPHLELLAYFDGAHPQTIVTCDVPGSALKLSCRGEFVFRSARITLRFAKPLLKDWQAMETRAQALLLSFAAPAGQ
jgi:hypothetical protein